jgi:hypothetical protein
MPNTCKNAITVNEFGHNMLNCDQCGLYQTTFSYSAICIVINDNGKNFWTDFLFLLNTFSGHLLPSLVKKLPKLTVVSLVILPLLEASIEAMCLEFPKLSL